MHVGLYWNEQKWVQLTAVIWQVEDTAQLLGWAKLEKVLQSFFIKQSTSVLQ